MQRRDRKGTGSAWIAAAGLVALAAGAPATGHGQEMLQLTAPAAEYTLGRFKYNPPQVDGWRQVANLQSSMSLVYAEQKSEDTIDTRFGVAIEVHDIPSTVQVENAAALADLSRRQMSEARKADLVGLSPIAPVASVENLYMYRMLVHSPIKGDPDAYEVYYIMMAPDKTQYLVIQCITKTQDYENELYFNQFFGSLASLKYVPDPAPGTSTGDAAPAAPAAAAKPVAPAGAAEKNADAAPAAH